MAIQRAKSVIDSISATKGLVLDLDNTLIDGRIAEGLGHGYIFDELRHLHFSNFVGGVRGARRIKSMLRKDPDNLDKEVEGLRMLYGYLVSRGVGTVTGMSRYAKKYVQSHLLVGSYVISRDAILPKFLATLGGSTGALSAMFALGELSMHFEDRVANIDLFDKKGRLEGIQLLMRSGEDKLESAERMLFRHGLKIKDCAAVGDNDGDVPMLMSAALPIASPLASEKVRKIAKMEMPLVIDLDHMDPLHKY